MKISSVDEFDMQVEEEAERLANEMDKQLKASIELCMNTFNYHMELARGELFEEYLNEKCEMELQWEKSVKSLKEKNAKALKQLQATSNADHAEKMAELEYWYEEQAHLKPILNMKNMTMKINREDDEMDHAVIPYAIRLHGLDVELQNKRNELAVYKNRLVRVLNGYMNFIEGCLQKHHGRNMFGKQLIQAKILLSKINKIEIKRSIELIENGNAPSIKKKKACKSTNRKLTSKETLTTSEQKPIL